MINAIFKARVSIYDSLMDPFVNDYTELDDNLLARVLNTDIENENIIFELIAREDIPAFVLDPKHLFKSRWILTLGNLFRRLMKIDDDHIINKWIGINGNNEDDNDPVSIFAFSFDIIDHYYSLIFCTRMVSYGDSYVSCYDYLITSACSFLLSLNQEQISVVEQLFVQRLFSPGVLQPLMASDLLCFMCRMSPKYTLELLEVLFKILKEIYFEDILSSEPIFNNGYKFTIEIVLKLCQRILKFLDDQEIGNLIVLFPISSNLTLWSNFDLNCKVAEIHFSPRKEIFSCQELLFIAKFSTDHRSSIVGPLIENFLNSVDLYETFFYLRLLTNLKFEFNFDQFNCLITKLRYLLIEELGLLDNDIRINTLRLLKPLEFATDIQYKDDEFNNNLANLLMVLFRKCRSAVDVFHCSVTMQNIFTNASLGKALKKLSTKKTIHDKVESHLKYFLAKDWKTNDFNTMTRYSKIFAQTYRENWSRYYKMIEEPITVSTNLEFFTFEATKSISYEELEKPDNKAKYTIIDLWPLTNDLQENYELLSLLVERMKQISFMDSNEKRRFLKVAQEMITVINENG